MSDEMMHGELGIGNHAVADRHLAADLPRPLEIFEHPIDERSSIARSNTTQPWSRMLST